MSAKIALKVLQSGVNAVIKKTSGGTKKPSGGNNKASGGNNKAATQVNNTNQAGSKAISQAAGAVIDATKAVGKAKVIGAGVVAAGVAGIAIYGDIKNKLDDLKGGGIGGAVGGGIGDGAAVIVPAIGSLLGGKGNGPVSLTYPETLKNPTLNPAHINFQFYDRNTKTKSTSINLPMPNNVSNPNSISWDQKDFGMVGDTVVKSLSTMKNSGYNEDSVKSHLNSMAERMKSVAFYTGMAELVDKAGGEKLGAEDILGAVDGKALNPFRTMLFRGVNFRSFNFVFDLVPFSESDCDTIYNIITAFRAHSSPDYSGDKMFFEYPDECQITYMWNTGANKWLNNFKRAVCTDVNIDYAPMGHWSSIRNGFPNIIRIDTKWTEVDIITRKDILLKDERGQRS